MPDKLTQEQVEKIFVDKGCELLEKYTNTMTPVSYHCKCGNVTKASVFGFRKSKGCYKCSAASGGRKYTLDEVRTEFASRGCELLSTEYISNNTPLDFKCKCGNITKIRFAKLLDGGYCQKCKGRAASERNRMPLEVLIKFCQEHGCTLLDSEIKNRKTRISYVCKCGEIAAAYWTNFKNFPNCKNCGNEKVSGENCYMWNPDRKKVALNKKFRKICDNMLRRCLKASGDDKMDYTHEILGYTPRQLQDHIQNHPEYPGSDFHVDHIFPIKAFLDHRILDVKIINALDNLRPLPGLENLSKADKYDQALFLKWVKEKINTPWLSSTTPPPPP